MRTHRRKRTPRGDSPYYVVVPSEFGSVIAIESSWVMLRAARLWVGTIVNMFGEVVLTNRWGCIIGTYQGSTRKRTKGKTSLVTSVKGGVSQWE